MNTVFSGFRTRGFTTVRSLPIATYVEFLSPSPHIDELLIVPFRPDADGLLTIPDAPGLGIELNRDALERYRVWE